MNAMKPKAIIVDLDGTLADCRHRRHFLDKKDWRSFFESMTEDPVNLHVYNFVKFHVPLSNILFVTGRPDNYRDLTLEWMRRNCPLHPGVFDLFMRRAGDYRPDHEVKLEIYRGRIEPNYDVRLVLDDRTSVVRMWRELGLECWQVAEGDF